jgi:hypothetical protein
MSVKLILVHTDSDCHVLFANQDVILDNLAPGGNLRQVENAARQLSKVLGVPLIECDVEADGDGNWEAPDLYALIPADHKLDDGSKSEVPVRHWDEYFWDANGPIHSDENTHVFAINDRRKSKGIAQLAIGTPDTQEGSDLLDVMMEVGTSPLDNTSHVPTMHVNLRGDAQLASLYRIGNRVLVMPNTGVTVTPSTVDVEGRAAAALWIE